jgi:tetratricopeptide (TPR) repeat protein
MDNINLEKQKANELRKKGDFKTALPIYWKLWEKSGDKFDGAGLLNCLRKLDLFKEALILADDLLIKFPTFNWCKIEIIWTYVQGRLEKFDEGVKINEVIQEAEKIMKLGPEGLARKMTVFQILKRAKVINRWDIVDQWINRLKPEELSKEAIKDAKGREGWCDQSLWYNYYIKCLLEKKETDTSIKVVDQIIEIFPKQRKFFLRYKALAFYMEGNLKEAENIYSSLSQSYSDWWIHYEYAKVLRDLGNKEKALRLMCKAAIENKGKIETMVPLFEDVGSLLKEEKKYEASHAHFLLSKYIRTSKNWTVKDSLVAIILQLEKMIKIDEEHSFDKTLKFCKNYWQAMMGQHVNTSNSKRRGLIGNLVLGPDDRNFCFINMNNETFFCVKSDLPLNVHNEVSLIFDALPSFDKKKNKESWKAVNISLKN